jgi:hypothetical protein
LKLFILNGVDPRYKNIFLEGGVLGKLLIETQPLKLQDHSIQLKDFFSHLSLSWFEIKLHKQ